MTILLVILVLSGLLAISIGIFNVVFFETQIAGEMTGSFRAIYVAEQGLERTLCLDRGNCSVTPILSDASPPCPQYSNVRCYVSDTSGTTQDPATGACFRVVMLYDPASGFCGAGRTRCIASTGTYSCTTVPLIKRNTGFIY